MPVQDIREDNLAANVSNLNVINGEQVSQVDVTTPVVSVTIWAVASALGLTHTLVIGGRTPLPVSPVPVSATPDQIIQDQDGIVSGIFAVAGETLRLFVSEILGVATTDYLVRVNLKRVA